MGPSNYGIVIIRHNHKCYYYTVFASIRTSFSHLSLQKSRDSLMLPQARKRKPVTDVVQYEPLKKAERLQGKELTTIVTGILWSQNTPRCAPGKGEWNWGVFPPQGYHPGGVNGCMTDGSTRFFADNIDTGNLAAPEVTGGISPYGVWGAIDSKDGSESITLQ